MNPIELERALQALEAKYANGLISYEEYQFRKRNLLSAVKNDGGHYYNQDTVTRRRGKPEKASSTDSDSSDSSGDGDSDSSGSASAVSECSGMALESSGSLSGSN